MKYVISKKVDGFFGTVHDVAMFILRFFKEAFKPPFEFGEIIRQSYQVGYRSLALISMTGFITGFVFTKQSRPSLAEFGATSWLPSLVAIAIIRALAPLVTALICAGKVGSGIGAELGSMKVTEQIDAIEVSGVNSFKFLVVTRVWATTLMLYRVYGFDGCVFGYDHDRANQLFHFSYQRLQQNNIPGFYILCYPFNCIWIYHRHCGKLPGL